MATGNQLLYLELAKALGQPSKLYRALDAGIKIPEKGVEGYKYGADFADSLRERKLKKETLSEALGGKPPQEGLMNLTGEEGAIQRPSLAIWAAMEKAKSLDRDDPKPTKKQQANFLVGGKLMTFDPDSGTYSPAPVEGGATGTPTPRVAPTIPAEQVSKDAGLSDLSNDVSIIRNTKKPEYIGLVEYPKTIAKQRTGYKATKEAGSFVQTLSRLKNKVLQLRSGGQVTDGEAGRLLAEIPIGSTSEADFDARLDGFDNTLKNIMKERQQGFSQAGYRVPGSTQTQPTPSFGNAKTPSFNTPEEAEASGYKGPAIINGKRAVIH